ncbi:hypothetical protein GCM10009116_20390 [Brevundimonas basaltis]|uniref:Uncharacterized protein n=1 Tax=Brevundimonas basaltis TaxID=472166 RepID=A0A7W8HY23_9CAUL|nr:hypothetical protein [Brevundimonas basaltis]MBB5291789.1 hypothetical protein [Brevundimonas basaltis]
MFAILAATTLLSVDPVADCESRLVSYAGWRETPDTVWRLDIPAQADGRLVYLGARHVRDAADPQFVDIEHAFRDAAPTVVFFEGPDRGVGADGPGTIETRGESGYARWLAAQSGARAVSLEPSPLDQFNVLGGRFPVDQIELFFVLREAARLRDREHLTPEALESAVATLLSRFAGMTEGTGMALPFSDLDGLRAAYSRHWSDGSDWRAAPSTWFDPGADDARTGGRFMAAINAASSEARDVHMYRLLARAARSGERVFAVVGRNHVPMQAEALRCALAVDQVADPLPPP